MFPILPRFSRAVFAICIIHQKQCHCCNAAKHRSSRQRSTQILRGNNICQLRAAGQAGHGKGAGTGKQHRRNQVSRQIGLLKHGIKNWADSKHDHKQTHTAICQNSYDDNGRQNHALFAKPAKELISNRQRTARFCHNVSVKTGAAENQEIVQVCSHITIHIQCGQ